MKTATRTDSQLQSFLDRFAKQRRSIPVNFRTLVPNIRGPERCTHLLHPYPAKLLVHIPYFFLANDILTKPGDLVVDPFCGSGTVLLESLLAGRRSAGADSSPIARLISQVKTSPTKFGRLSRAAARVADGVPLQPTTPTPDVVNLTYWFYPHVIRQLHCLSEAIASKAEGSARDFLHVCFSYCVRKVSLADPRLSVPVRLRTGQYPDGHQFKEQTDTHIRRLRRVNVLNVFNDIVTTNLKRMRSLEPLPRDLAPHGIYADARALPLAAASVDLVLTSPPYVGAQKYVRSLSLSLGWLGLCGSDGLRDLKGLSIGREEFRADDYAQPLPAPVCCAEAVIRSIRTRSPIRAHIAAAYLTEMQTALREISRILKPEGHLILVVGNNRVAGHPFHAARYLRAIAETVGLSLRLCLVDDIHSRGLMTKRNKTASVITREHVMLFRKEGP